MSELTIDQLRTEIETLRKLRDRIDEIEAEADGIKKELEAKKLDILACLQRNNLENFKVPGVLNVSIRNEFYVKQPDTPEKEKAFKEWLESEGLDHLRKVNFQTLNALYRERIDAAAEQGEIVVIPGLDQPGIRTTLSMRRN